MIEELGVKLVRLDLPFRLNHVNCFLAEGENGWVVMDAGLHNDYTVKRWQEELAGKNVTDLYITHYHPDHFGYAGGMQEKYNLRVSMTEIDAKSGKSSWQEDTMNELYEKYKLAGIPQEHANKMVSNTKSFVPRVTPYPEVQHYFVEGEKVVLGKYEYEVYFTPGHADGLINLYNKDKGVLFSTDHILPRITPNISYWFHGDPNPLKTYLKSLDKISKLDAQYVIPSHGKAFYGANDRIAEIKSHHDERLDATLEALREGGTVYDVCQILFNFQLTVHELRFAIGETLAHMEYLRIEGECDREIYEGQWRYSIK